MDTKHYLRLLRTFALATLTAAAVTACTDDNGDPAGSEPITPADGIPVTFTANINPGSDADPAGAPGTRTVLTPTDDNGFTVTWKGLDTYSSGTCDNICIWAAKENTLAFQQPKLYLPTTSAASSALKPMNGGEKLTLSSSGKWDFTAIYGYYARGEGKAAASISSLTQSEPGNTEHIAIDDFSVATAEQQDIIGDNSEMPAIISFKFKHMLSALQLQVKNGTSEALTVKEIRLSVTGEKITTKKYYGVTDKGWIDDGKLESDYLQLKIQTPAALASNDGTVQKFHMLLFPEPAHGGTDMNITVITDRGEYTLTKGAPTGGFLAAKNYLTNIVIKTDGLTAEEKWVETISSKAELIAFRNKVNNGTSYQGKTVRLTADIDLANETWTTPIGTSAKPFSGTFDGGGYHISKLSVDKGSNNYAGLFGYVYGGTVRNLRVSGTVTTTGSNAGGIAGYLSESSTVENCIFDGNVSGSNGVGGIAGNSLGNCRIAGCHTKGTVTATTSQNAGGIAGLNNKSTIDGCYSKAEVTTGNWSAGGIAGTNESGGTVTHCYATGKVSGKNYVGGIAGYTSGGTFTGCIALNPGLTRTSGSETDFGRVVGNNQSSSTITNCGAFADMTLPDGVTATSAADGIHGAALPAADCLTAAAYTSRNFPEATATTPGWAFSAATPWTYLPWNTVFESFHNISETDYRIAVPAYLNGGGTN